MSNDNREISSATPKEEDRKMSRRDFLKGAIVGGATVGVAGLLGSQAVDVLSGTSNEEVQEDGLEISKVIDQFVNQNENVVFWNKFKQDLKKGSSNFEIHDEPTVDSLTKNSHVYDYWQNGNKDGFEDAQIAVIDPDGQSTSSRVVLIDVTMGDDGNLGNVPGTVEDRDWPLERVQNAFSQFFKLPLDAGKTEWEMDNSAFALNGKPLKSSIKTFDSKGYQYRLGADTRGQMDLTIWYPQPNQNQY
jgi:hypothetical protein